MARPIPVSYVVTKPWFPNGIVIDPIDLPREIREGAELIARIFSTDQIMHLVVSRSGVS